jgi:hypothetical protein
MNQPEITEAKELEIDPRGGLKTREAQQSSKASQSIPGEGKLSPWKFPRKEVYAAVT